MVTHYVDNTKMYQEMVAFKKAVRRAKRLKLPRPQIPRYIGECWMLIANKLSTKANFVNYPFREEMISDAIENCVLYVDSFNCEKYDKPFAYFTQVIYYAFLRRITKEKKQLYIKQKVMEHTVTLEHLDQYMSEMVDLNNDKMHDIVDNFETKLDEKKSKRENKVKQKAKAVKVKKKAKSKVKVA